MTITRTGYLIVGERDYNGNTEAFGIGNNSVLDELFETKKRALEEIDRWYKGGDCWNNIRVCKTTITIEDTAQRTALGKKAAAAKREAKARAGKGKS